MPLDQLTQTRLIVLAVLVAIAAAWALARWRHRRERDRFAKLAAAFSATVEEEDEWRWSFRATLENRLFEVLWHHQAEAVGSHGGSRRYLVTRTALGGVSELHCIEFAPRGRRRAAAPGGGDVETRFAVRDFGLSPRDGWLTGPVRTAIADFFALELPLGPLNIEAGGLVHRGSASLTRRGATALRELLVLQAAVAAALEREL